MNPLPYQARCATCNGWVQAAEAIEVSIWISRHDCSKRIEAK